MAPVRFSRLFMVPGWFLMGVHGCRSFFMVPGWYFMVFHGSRSFFYGCSWFQVVFYGSRLVFHGFSWFQVGCSCFFMVFHDSRLVFHGFHGSRWVFNVSRCVFYGFFMVLGWFFMVHGSLSQSLAKYNTAPFFRTIIFWSKLFRRKVYPAYTIH